MGARAYGGAGTHVECPSWELPRTMHSALWSDTEASAWPGSTRQLQKTLFLKKSPNGAGLTQPRLGSLHRTLVWEEKAIEPWLVSMLKKIYLPLQGMAPWRNCSAQQWTNYSRPPIPSQYVLPLHVSPYTVIYQSLFYISDCSLLSLECKVWDLDFVSASDEILERWK